MRLSGACCVGIFLLTGFTNTTTATSDLRLVDATARQDAAAVRQLIDEGVPGLHFYALNRSQACGEILEALGRGAPPAACHE